LFLLMVYLNIPCQSSDSKRKTRATGRPSIPAKIRKGRPGHHDKIIQGIILYLKLLRKRIAIDGVYRSRLALHEVKKNMMKELDEIDISVLDRISRKPGCSISYAIRPLLIERSESVLRGRVRALEIRKLISFIPTKHKVLLYRNPVEENESDERSCYSPEI
jgi:hypothetical protein